AGTIDDTLLVDDCGDSREDPQPIPSRFSPPRTALARPIARINPFRYVCGSEYGSTSCRPHPCYPHLWRAPAVSYRTWTYRALFVIPLLLGVLVMLGGASGTGLLADGRHHVVGPSHSGPIAVTPDDRFVWVANPDDDSVTLIDVGGDANRVVDRIRVGAEP